MSRAMNESTSSSDSTKVFSQSWLGACLEVTQKRPRYLKSFSACSMCMLALFRTLTCNEQHEEAEHEAVHEKVAHVSRDLEGKLIMQDTVAGVHASTYRDGSRDDVMLVEG